MYISVHTEIWICTCTAALFPTLSQGSALKPGFEGFLQHPVRKKQLNKATARSGIEIKS